MVVYHHKKHDINDDKDHIKNDLELAGTLVAQQAYLDPTANYGVVWGVYGSSITGQLTYNFTNSRFEFTDDVYAPNFIGNGSQLTNITAEALNLSVNEWLYFNYPTNTVGMRYTNTTIPAQFELVGSKFVAPNIVSGNSVTCSLLYSNYVVVGYPAYSPGLPGVYLYMIDPSTNKVTYTLNANGGQTFWDCNLNNSYIIWKDNATPTPVTQGGIGVWNAGGGVYELEIYTSNAVNPIQMYSTTNLWEDTALQDGKYLFFDTARTKSLWYDGTTNNRFEFNDALYTSGTMTIGAYTLPNTDGSANYVLKTNGSGVVSWQPDTAGTNYWTQASGVLSPATSTDSLGIAANESIDFNYGATAKTLLYDAATDNRFEFNDSVYTSGDIIVGGATYGVRWDTDKLLRFNASPAAYEFINYDVNVTTLNASSSISLPIDSELYFNAPANTKYLLYDGTTHNRFEFNDKVYTPEHLIVDSMKSLYLNGATQSVGISHATSGIPNTIQIFGADTLIQSDLRLYANKLYFDSAKTYELKWSTGNTRFEFNNPLYVNGTLTVGAYTLPSTDGAANYVLKTNGSGVVSWQPDSAGTNYWARSGTTLYPATSGDDIGLPAGDFINFNYGATAKNLLYSSGNTRFEFNDGVHTSGSFLAENTFGLSWAADKLLRFNASPAAYEFINYDVNVVTLNASSNISLPADSELYFNSPTNTKYLWYDGTDLRFEFNDSVYATDFISSALKNDSYYFAYFPLNDSVNFTSGIETTGDRKIYNRYTAPSGTGTNGTLYCRNVTCPNFSVWRASNSIHLSIRSSTTSAVYTATVYINGVADATINGVTKSVAVVNTWETWNLQPGTTPAIGDRINIQINCAGPTGAGTKTVDVSDVYVDYRGFKLQ